MAVATFTASARDRSPIRSTKSRLLASMPCGRDQGIRSAGFPTDSQPGNPSSRIPSNPPCSARLSARKPLDSRCSLFYGRFMDSSPQNADLAGDGLTGGSQEPAGEVRPAAEDVLIARQLEALAQLTATGQATRAEADAFAGTDLALGYSRIVKAMGQTALLAQETLKLRESRRVEA